MNVGNNNLLSNISRVIQNPGPFIADTIGIIPFILKTNKDIKEIQDKISQIANVLLNNDLESSYEYLDDLKSDYELLEKRVVHIEKWSAISRGIGVIQSSLILPWVLSNYINRDSNSENAQRYNLSDIFTYIDTGRYLVGTLIYCWLWKGKKIPNNINFFLKLLIWNLPYSAIYINDVDWTSLKSLLINRYTIIIEAENITEAEKEKNAKDLDRAFDAFLEKLLRQ